MCHCFEQKKQEVLAKLQESEVLSLNWSDEALNVQKVLTLQALCKTAEDELIKKYFSIDISYCPFCGEDLTQTELPKDENVEKRIEEMFLLYKEAQANGFTLDNVVAIQTIAEEIRSLSPKRFAQISNFDIEGYGDYVVSKNGMVEIIKNSETVHLHLEECVRTLELEQDEYSTEIQNIFIYNQHKLFEHMEQADEALLAKVEKLENALENRFKYITVKSMDEMINITQEEMLAVGTQLPLERLDEEDKITLTAKGYLEDHMLELYLDYDIEDEDSDTIFYSVNVF